MAQNDLTADVHETRVLVEPGWTSSYFVRNPGGDTYRVLCWPDGRMGFEHRCRIIDGTQLIVAPRLQLEPGGHWVLSTDPLTIEPSIMCGDCGLHGFVRGGYWVDA